MAQGALWRRRRRGRAPLQVNGVLVDDDLHHREILAGLWGMGVKLAIDDFGTGYSSLRYLERIPVDVVKIDRRFVAGLGRNRYANAIVASMVELARALDLQVVAEGVEIDAPVAVVGA